MKKQLAKLLEIKNLIALILIFVYSYVLIAQIPLDESFKSIMLVVIGFFFGSSIKGTQH